MKKTDPNSFGMYTAARVFDQRSRGKKGFRNVEIHISEVELAGLLALAYEKGVRDGRYNSGPEETPDGDIRTYKP